MGLNTVLGLKKQGIFIPYRHAASLKAPQGGYAELGAWMAQAEPRMAGLLTTASRFAEPLATFDGAAPPRPRWQQGWFPALDGVAAYTIVASRRPGRIIEVGSGHSTRFLARAALDAGLDCPITCIDPAPRADLEGLGVELHRRLLRAGDSALAATLEAGDVLFIDSSHLALPGSDLDLLIGGWLPRLPAGVLVHFHDIFLPDDYPQSWHWRGYNEHQAVAALIAAGGFELVFSSHYVASRMAATLADSVAGPLPNPTGAPQTSLWLRKLTPALAP